MKTLILKNCHILTFNPTQPKANALAIRDGRFLLVGSTDEVLSQCGQDAYIQDLQGRCVLPGLTDAHIHMLEYGFSLQRVNCETETREACLERVRVRAQTTTGSEWIRGHGWNHHIWPEGTGDKSLLDSVSPQNPVYLTHKSLHSAWANSAALKAAGIQASTDDPPGGQILRDKKGQPTGILLESAMRLLEAAVPHPDQATRIKALLAAQENLLVLGITSTHDFDPWEVYAALQEIEANQQLRLRVMKGVPLPNLDEAIQNGLKSGMGNDHLTIGWLKLFADGALGPQTAAMLAPYEGSQDTGMLLLDQEEISTIGNKALNNGLSLAVHAIGDHANREVLDGYAQLARSGSLSQSRLPVRIEHLQLIHPEDISRLAALGVTASMQPIHALSDREMAERYWGNRCEYAYAWNSVASTGAKLIFGSDAPVESPNPYWGLATAISRTSPWNSVPQSGWRTKQCLDPVSALTAYVRTPHQCAGKGDRLGQIKAGFLADLVVLPYDPLILNADEVAALMPNATMVDGQWVNGRLE